MGVMSVLYGPPFAIHEPSRTVDYLLMRELKRRGCRITSVWCDQVQETECAVYGGVWGGDQFRANCASCAHLASSQGVADREIPLSKLIDRESREDVRRLIGEMELGAVAELELDGYSFGSAARQILSNMWTTETWSDVPDAARLLRAHVSNLLVLDRAYVNVLSQESFERVISNDTSYGMWGILAHRAAERDIPTYSVWPVKDSRVAVGDKNPAVQPAFSEPWDEFKSIILEPREEAAVDEFIRSALSIGSGTTSGPVPGDAEHMRAPADASPRGSAVVLAMNALWDLASYEKQALFADVEELICKTISWFATTQRSRRLIVRSHPVESDPALPPTRKTVASLVIKALSLESVSQLPNWLHLDAGDTPLGMWLDSGATVVVHTSTVGAVAAASGNRVITTGHAPYRGLGFTTDPMTPDEYFAFLADADSVRNDAETVTLARKYLLLQNFAYYSDWKMFERSNWLRVASVRRRSTTTRNPGFEYIIDRILAGQRIMDEKSWPPVTVN